MRPDPRDWHAVALNKLSNVLGTATAEQTAASVLKELGLGTLGSAADLREFAHALTRRGGFAGTVGALLGVHAAIHGESPGVVTGSDRRSPNAGS